MDLSSAIQFSHSKLDQISFDDFSKSVFLFEKDNKKLAAMAQKIQNFRDMQSMLGSIEKLANRHLFDLEKTDKWDDFSMEILMKNDTGNSKQTKVWVPVKWLLRHRRKFWRTCRIYRTWKWAGPRNSTILRSLIWMTYFQTERLRRYPQFLTNQICLWISLIASSILWS